MEITLNSIKRKIVIIFMIISIRVFIREIQIILILSYFYCLQFVFFPFIHIFYVPSKTKIFYYSYDNNAIIFIL